MSKEKKPVKKSRRLLLILVCVLAAAIIGFLIFAFGLSQGYTFHIQVGGAIQITGFWGIKENAVIPSKLLGRPVDSMIDMDEPSLARLELPRSIAYIYPQGWASNTKLEEIQVDKSNPAFSSQDGVLFADSCYLSTGYVERDLIKLLMYPPHKEGTSYTVPDNVVYLSMFSFHNCKKLREVHLPASIRAIEGNPFSGSGITDVYFHGTQEQWESIELPYSFGQTLEGITLHIVGE